MGVQGRADSDFWGQETPRGLAEARKHFGRRWATVGVRFEDELCRGGGGTHL